MYTCFDAMLGGYAYSGVKDDEILYSWVIIFHIFVINILMLNYMIAILSMTYGAMLESGSFLYKCALYEYCERYMIAFQEERLGEFVIHSPPVNLMCLIMLPFTIIPDSIVDGVVVSSVMSRIAYAFSIFNFWLENIFFIIYFIVYEIVLMPFVFFLTFFNIMYSTHGLFTTAFNVIKWAIFGFIYLLYLLLNDTRMLIQILAKHKGCKESDPKNDKQKIDETHIDNDLNKQIMVFNDVRTTVIQMYLDIHKHMIGEIDDAEEKTDS